MVDTTDELRTELAKRGCIFAVGLLASLLSAFQMASDVYLQAESYGNRGGSLVSTILLLMPVFVLGISVSFLVFFDTSRVIRN